MDNSAGCPCGALIATERSSLTVKDLRPIELSSLVRGRGGESSFLNIPRGENRGRP